MSTRLILDEFDIDLATFATGSGLVVIVVVGGGADARTLDSAIVGAIGVVWIVRAGGMLYVGVFEVGDVGHL